jgi:DEAD/DEAH box helicase domain-containing protein
MAEARDLQKAVGSGDAAFFATQDQRGRGQWRNAEGKVEDSRAESTTFNPTVYLYDNFPGGIGLSEPLFRRARGIDREGARPGCRLQLHVGCPACVGPVLAGDESGGVRRGTLARAVLDLLA